MWNGESDDDFEDNVPPQKVIEIAKDIALEHNCIFVGTEHFILALIKSDSCLLPWIKQKVEIDLDLLENLAKELVEITASRGTAEFYSPSLLRAIQIAKALRKGPQNLATEAILVGTLLAHKDVPNAVGHIFHKTCQTDILTLLKESLPYIKKRLNRIPYGYSSSYSFTWYDNPINSTGNGTLKGVSSTGSGPPVPRKTHWVVPGQILCGSSPGNMKDSEILALVEAGVDTFVCLQEEYTEYGCEDYRVTLRQMNKKKLLPAVTIQFLHCPVPDFGVLPDKCLLGLVSELRKCLKKDKRVLYIHCYGGHGRTGTVLVNLLQPVLGLSKQQAMETLKGYHKQRGCSYCSLNSGQLEASSQEVQTERLQPIMYTRQRRIDIEYEYEYE